MKSQSGKGRMVLSRKQTSREKRGGSLPDPAWASAQPVTLTGKSPTQGKEPAPGNITRDAVYLPPEDFCL